MAQLPALTQLYNKISENMSDDDLNKLRNLLVPEILSVARVQHATALEIFRMLQADNKIGHGNLRLLVEILQSLGKGRLAEETEKLEQQQRAESEAQVQQAAAQAPTPTAAVQQTAPMSEAHRTLLLRNYPTLYQELDATRVLGYLHQHRVLTDEMRETILAIPEDQRHNRTGTLLQMILQMGDDTFTIFRTALGHAGYRHLMELLSSEGQQQQLMPPMPLAMAVYTGFQGREESFQVSTGEQPSDQLNVPNQYLLTTAYQKEQVLQLKTRMMNKELKGVYKHQKKQLRIAHKKLSQESFEKLFDKLQAKVEDERAIIVSKYRGCVILFLTFESEPKFAHFWGSCTSGRLSDSLTELLMTEEMRSLEGGDQLVVRTLVLEQDYRAWRDFFGKGATEQVQADAPAQPVPGDPKLPEEEQVEQVTSHLASLGTSKHTEELEITQKTRAGSIRSIASVQSVASAQSVASTISSGSVLSSDSGYASAESHMTLSEGKKIAPKYKTEAEEAISNITEGMGNIDKELNTIKQNCQEVEKEIQQHYKKLRSQLKSEEQEMINKVQEINRDRKGELTQEKKKLQMELGKNKEKVAFSQKILDCKGDKEFHILKQQMEERFQKVSQQEIQNVGNKSFVGHTGVAFHPRTVSQASGGSLSVFTLHVDEPAVESLPCSVTVTTNTVDLTGGDVTPQIEVTSPQGKTTLIQTTEHSSPPLAAGKGQTSRARRVWGGVWRPQESGKHTMGVCMGGNKDLGFLTVDVGSNNPVLRFGQKGSQQGQLDRPTCIYVAVRGDRLYVADNANQHVQVFDLNGNFYHSFPTSFPAGIAVQTDGTIVVKSEYEVKKFSPSGKLLHKFPLGEYCTKPYGLAVQRDGRVVIADYGKHSIFLFEADGRLVKQVGGKGKGEGQFDEPLFVCVDKEDNIIVADKLNHRVQVFDKNLNFKHKFGQFGRQPEDMWAPHGVSADSRGNIVLANRGDKSDVGGAEHGRKLQVFRPNGMWVSTISSDGDKLNGPHGVAVTEDGHVFVADPFDHCIRKYRYM